MIISALSYKYKDFLLFPWWSRFGLWVGQKTLWSFHIELWVTITTFTTLQFFCFFLIAKQNVLYQKKDKNEFQSTWSFKAIYWLYAPEVIFFLFLIFSPLSKRHWFSCVLWLKGGIPLFSVHTVCQCVLFMLFLVFLCWWVSMFSYVYFLCNWFYFVFVFFPPELWVGFPVFKPT